MSKRLEGVPFQAGPEYPIGGGRSLHRPFVVDGVTYRVVDIGESEGVGGGRAEDVLEAWALRVGGLLWVLDSEVTGWPLSAEDEERAWEMVREGTRRLGELGELGELGPDAEDAAS